MKLLFASDLLGSEAHYSRLAALAARVRPEIVILGGNCLPDDSALSPDKMGHGQPQFVRHPFRKFALGLREVPGHRATLVIFGNHDWGSSVAAMRELAGEGLVQLLGHTEPVVVNGLTFLGYSCTPPTDWFVKEFERLDLPGDRIPLMGGARWDPRFGRPSPNSAATIFKTASTIADDLATLAVPSGPWVFVAHAPPYDSKLDRDFSNQPRGSRAIRAAIEKRRPFLSLHGHARESFQVSGAFEDRIGACVSVNPGQTPQRLSYALITVDPAGGKVLNLQHGQQA